MFSAVLCALYYNPAITYLHAYQISTRKLSSKVQSLSLLLFLGIQGTIIVTEENHLYTVLILCPAACHGSWVGFSRLRTGSSCAGSPCWWLWRDRPALAAAASPPPPWLVGGTSDPPQQPFIPALKQGQQEASKKLVATALEWGNGSISWCNISIY